MARTSSSDSTAALDDRVEAVGAVGSLQAVHTDPKKSLVYLWFEVPELLVAPEKT